MRSVTGLGACLSIILTFNAFCSLYWSQGTPVMTLGSHELKGKIEKLKQPFVVMRKRKRAHGLTGGVDEKLDLESMDTYAATVEDHGSTDGSVSYEVAGIITQKMLFDKYPKSIMR